MKFKGKVIHIGGVQNFDSGFSKQAIIIQEENSQWENPIKFEFVKDGIAQLEAVQIGDTVTAHFNLRGNEYQGKYYVNLQGWKLDRAGPPQDQPQQAQQYQQGPPPGGYSPPQQDYQDDDIPFG